MKKVVILFHCFILLMATSACKKSTGVANDEKVETDLGSYIQTVKLPNNLTIEFGAKEVKSMGSAKIYTASVLEIDEKKAIEHLLRGKITSTEIYAEGPCFATDEDEFLIIYDGGKRSGIDSGVNGGISYGGSKDIRSKLSPVVTSEPGPPDTIAQKWGFYRKSDYESFSNLNFMDYTDALTTVQRLLSTIGFPEITVAEAYSLDLESMVEQYGRYIDARSDFNNEIENFDYTKDDETYLFLFQQKIDEIPISNIIWQKEPLSSGEINATRIDVYYSKDDEMDIYSSHLFDVAKDGKEKLIISEATALKKVIDSYSDVLIENRTKILSMELSYITMYTGTHTYELIPAWIFTIAETGEWTNHDGSVDIYDTYDYYVVNAVTGDRIEKASDIK